MRDRMQTAAGAVFAFDDVRVDTAAARLTKAGRPLTLEPRAFDVLVYLLRHRARLVEKQELLDHVWRETFVTENNLAQAISQLRRALGDSARSPRYIETVPTRGYRFIAAVAGDRGGAPDVLRPRRSRWAVVSLAGVSLAGVLSYATISTPVPPKAYELYLQGTFHSQQRSAPSLERAVESFEQAIALDPAFAPAYAGLARAKFAQDLFGGTRFPTQADAVRRAAAKARALDPTLAEAHEALGLVLSFYDWDWNGAERAFRTALALDPRRASAHSHFSFLFQALGRFDDAVAQASRAVALDPRSPLTLSDEGRALFRARRYEEAEDRYRRALAIDRGFGPALDRLLQLYVVQGRFPEVQRIVDSLEHAPPYKSPLGFRAWLQVPAGNIESARALLAKLERPSRAHLAVALGDHDAAFGILERAVTTRTIYPFSWADPALDPLRKDPRFARLVHAMGLPVDRLVAIGGA